MGWNQSPWAWLCLRSISLQVTAGILKDRLQTCILVKNPTSPAVQSHNPGHVTLSPCRLWYCFITKPDPEPFTFTGSVRFTSYPTNQTALGTLQIVKYFHFSLKLNHLIYSPAPWNKNTFKHLQKFEKDTILWFFFLNPVTTGCVFFTRLKPGAGIKESQSDSESFDTELLLQTWNI